LEIVNHTRLPVKIQTGIGICQINFLESDEDCETSYADRGGKYQNQPMNPVDPKV
jgi:dCTP deaminase